MGTLFEGCLSALRTQAVKVYDETGLLLRDDNELLLARDAGGTWRLDAPRRASALVGQRVRIKGQRIDFDRLSVSAIVRC